MTQEQVLTVLPSELAQALAQWLKDNRHDFSWTDFDPEYDALVPVMDVTCLAKTIQDFYDSLL